ncbi:hypothetical protein HK096_001158 [Nowakowskiella sp. JEL0078]|nr:hypothetical protein HK096_001158 [Nowakowskiella sp. JEL0078]
MANSLQHYAAYNVWAYGRLFQTLRTIPNDKYLSNQGLAFRYARFVCDHETHISLGSHWRKPNDVLYSTPESSETYWESIVTDRDDLETKIKEQAQKFCDLIQATDLNAVDVLVFPDERYPEPRNVDYLTAILHVVNHATHHRGQISAAITRLGYEPPIMDLLYYPGNQLTK